MIDNYILIGQTAVPCPDVLEWARWFEENDRRVGSTKVLGMCHVSTIFLGLNHDFGRHFVAQEAQELAAMLGLAVHAENRPILFESMAFWAGDCGEEQARCSTWAEAEEMHKRMVAEVVRPRSVLAYVMRVFWDAWGHAKGEWEERWREIRGLPRDDYDDPMMGEMMERMRERRDAGHDEEWKLYG